MIKATIVWSFAMLSLVAQTLKTGNVEYGCGMEWESGNGGH